MPEQIDRHDISDEELTLLVDPRRDSLSEQKWAFLGIAGGSLPGALAGFVHYVGPGDASFVEFVQIVLSFVFGALAFWTYTTDNKLAESPKALAAKIRARISEQGAANGEE